MDEDEKPIVFPISPRKIKREKETPPKESLAADFSNFLGTLFGIEPRPEEEEDEKKNVEPMKSSDEILTELFQVFNAAPPKKITKDKSKKKHKKHKKKSKKKKKDGDESSTDSEQSEGKVKKIKQEDDEKKKKSKKDKKKSPEKEKDKDKDKDELPGIESLESSRKKEEKESKESAKEKDSEGKSHKIIIKDLRNSTILSTATKVEKEKSKDHHSRDKSSRKRHRETGEDRRKKPDKGLSDFSISDEEDYHHREYLPLRNRGDELDSRRRDRRSGRSRHDDGFRGSSYREGRETRDRFWGTGRRPRSRSRSRSEKSSEKIDKKKLLEIARKNAIGMLKNGTLPGCQNLAPADKAKALAKMTHGGKTIEELTDYCKKLSNGETLNDVSSASSGNEDSDHDRDGNARAFHHPFVVKDRGPIVMNIKNSVPIPPKTAEQTKALLMQFPVSSGQHHRATESEWVPVSPKKPDPPKEPKKSAPIPAKQLSQAFYTIPTEELPPPTPARPSTEPAETESIFPEATTTLQKLDVSSIISQRLNAMRKLQENPQDKDAQELMSNTQKDMSNWATSKFTPGKFLGSTGANILSAKELQSGFQAWAKRDQLISTVPVSGGMGMHLLQKMGWRPGEALGKDKSGSLHPLLLEVKLDKRGLAANEENPQQAKKRRMTAAQAKEVMQNKHPVSLLGEISSKRKWLSPIYEVVMESGPGHHKNFLFRVTLNGISYTPQNPSNNKKEAKAVAARCCLQQLGIIN